MPPSRSRAEGQGLRAGEKRPLGRLKSTVTLDSVVFLIPQP